MKVRVGVIILIVLFLTIGAGVAISVMWTEMGYVAPLFFLGMMLFNLLLGLSSLWGFYGKNMPTSAMIIATSSSILLGGGVVFLLSKQWLPTVICGLLSALMSFLVNLPRRFHDT